MDERSSLLRVIQAGSQIEAWEAAKKIVQQQDLGVVDELLEILRCSTDDDLRIVAAWILGCLRSLKALNMLCRILAERSQSAALRDQAAESLGYLADARARDVLVGNLTDENADVVFSCVFALRTVGARRDIQHLEKLTDDDALNSYGASIAKEARAAIEAIEDRARQE